MSKYRVVAASGSTVNLRQMTSTNSRKLCDIAVGCVVEAAPAAEGWMHVVGTGYDGYMMAKFLEPVDEAADFETRLRQLEERVAALEGGRG